ncbi:MAG: ABC transporter permease [Deferrisomatales bacterium]|nr:ABC transporter permease [Deferrisomatales bacterium]
MRLLQNVSYRFVRVWQRNFTVYRKTWKIGFVPPLLEPLFYLVAFGAGLGVLVGEVAYRGEGYSYVRFITPALLAVTVMQNAFFENTYASFVRMYYQKTFDAILATPLSLEDVITGEIAWGATKSVLAATLMLCVLTPFGLIAYPHALLIPLVALLGGLAFGCIGMWFTGMMPNIEVFNLPVFLFVTPMFLFSGTFFPLETLPLWAQRVALAFPLTHLVAVIRGLAFGRLDPFMLGGLVYLVAFAALFYPLALRGMRRRLVK